MKRHRTMKDIRKFYIIMALLLVSCFTAGAQPKSATQGLLTLKTYKRGGKPVGTAYGVLIDRNGTVLSSWSPFNGADSAVVVDGADAVIQWRKFTVPTSSMTSPNSALPALHR